MNPLDFLQYMPEKDREKFIKELLGGGGGNIFNSIGNTAKKVGDFAVSNVGQIGTAAEGLVGMADNLFGGSGVHNDKDGNRMATDIYGRPIYSSQSYKDSIEAIEDNSKGEIGRSIGKGIGSGATTGAAIGSIVPGIGTAIGAVGGAIVGGLTGWLGGKKRKKEMREEISNRENLLDKSIDMFNRDNLNYFENNSADSIKSYLLSQRASRIYS